MKEKQQDDGQWDADDESGEVGAGSANGIGGSRFGGVHDRASIHEECPLRKHRPWAGGDCNDSEIGLPARSASKGRFLSCAAGW
jgi:hypothetical protein